MCTIRKLSYTATVQISSNGKVNVILERNPKIPVRVNIELNRAMREANVRINKKIK